MYCICVIHLIFLCVYLTLFLLFIIVSESCGWSIWWRVRFYNIYLASGLSTVSYGLWPSIIIGKIISFKMYHTYTLVVRIIACHPCNHTCAHTRDIGPSGVHVPMNPLWALIYYTANKTGKLLSDKTSYAVLWYTPVPCHLTLHVLLSLFRWLRLLVLFLLIPFFYFCCCNCYYYALCVLCTLPHTRGYTGEIPENIDFRSCNTSM